MKPHKGTLREWRKLDCAPHGLGYRIAGVFVGHPEFDGEAGMTSYVVAHDEATGEIETRNSRYTLIGPEQE